jgi:conjugative relaxase-like TrwC/TraI family protein
MVATWTPAANSGYYVSQTEYYLEGKHNSAVWYNPSDQFGIYDRETVEATEFENLFAGLNSDGETLLPASGRRSDRTPAFDYTLSAPRSMSLLWAGARPATKSAIEHAQAEAVRAVLKVLEKEASYARRGKGGTVYEKVPIAAACFPHCDSRPALHRDGREFGDPNLHTHCVIPNLAVRSDGTVGALHSTVLRDWKMAAGATYHAALAHHLQKLGFAVDRIGHNGVFEIAGVDDDIIEYFSARHNEIVDELSTLGTTGKDSPALASSIAKSTRAAKISSQDISSPDIWKEAALANGFNVDALESIALEAAKNKELINESNSILESYRSGVINELMETRSVVDRRDLVRTGTAFLVGSGLGAEQISQKIERLLGNQDFVVLGSDAIGALRYSTPERIRIERNVVALSSNLAREKWHEIEPKDIAAQAASAGLSSEQSAAALRACSSSRIACVEGSPGSGKTTTLAPIVAAYKNAGVRVLGAASAWRIANVLRDDLQIESRALASWLERDRHNQSFLDNRTVLIVDESGLINSEDTHTLLQAVETSGAKVILVGDRDQLQAIGGAAGLSLVARAVENAHVTTIVRQKEAWARNAVIAFGSGNAATALSAFAERELLIETEGETAAIIEVGDRWSKFRQINPAASTLLIAKTNSEVRAINEQIRLRLKIDGVVHGPEISLRAVTPSGHAAGINLAAGDEIRFLKRNDNLGVINGTVGTVLSISGQPVTDVRIDPVIEVNVQGRKIRFPVSELADENNRIPLSHAYASTIYGSQGLTVDHAIVLLNPTFDKHDAYVAVSRARDSTELVINKRLVNKSIFFSANGYDTNRDIEPSQAERISWLATRMSRANIKESTVDLMDLEAHKLTTHHIRPMEKRLGLEMEV